LATSARCWPLAQTGYRPCCSRTFAGPSKPRCSRRIGSGKIAVKGLLTMGRQLLQRYRVRFRVGPPHARLHELRVKLSPTWESGPWGPPWVTNSIHKKLSCLAISARQPDSPPHARLYGFRVKLPATWGSGPWRPPRVTNLIPKKRSRLSISARQQRDS